MSTIWQEPPTETLRFVVRHDADDRPPSPCRGRMPLQLPAGSVDHFTSQKPLSKRAKRRMRGK